jgi:hypothetical protein
MTSLDWEHAHFFDRTMTNLACIADDDDELPLDVFRFFVRIMTYLAWPMESTISTQV